MPTIVFDTEIFANRFLFCGRVAENRNVISIWMHEPDYRTRLMEVMQSGCTFVGFNSYRFDLPVISAVLSGATQEQVKALANRIIEHDLNPWQVYDDYRMQELQIDHIDLINVAPGTYSSLKSYGARMHMTHLQDIPYHHDAVITDEQCPNVLSYCVNDLDTTEKLYTSLAKEMELRVTMSAEYGLDMRSKSDTQMAEAAFVKRLSLGRSRTGVPKSVRYVIPKFINFSSPHLQTLAKKVEEHEYILNPKTGHVILPEFLEKEIVTINQGTYQVGVGGLHSTHDKKVCHVASDDYIITDIDAASFYPSIIINCNLIPQNTGQRFIDEYKQVYYRRLEAKKAGNKAVNETLKISLNGTFGKTASRWSPLYSPDLTIAITLTGQLTLLNLIERVEDSGATVLSANTDGIAVGGTRRQMLYVEQAVTHYSTQSGFEFEYTPYRTLAIANVNNYIAVTKAGKIKGKGLFAEPDLKKNPTAYVCTRAVCEWLRTGTDFLTTIRSAPFTQFISARSVTGGSKQGEEPLGRVVRWYMSTDKSLPPLVYASNGNKVPKTDGARACMTIKDPVSHPVDLDYEWYRKEAITIAQNVGCEEYLTDEEKQLVYVPPKVRKTRSKAVNTNILLYDVTSHRAIFCVTRAQADRLLSEYPEEIARTHPDFETLRQLAIQQRKVS